MCRLQNIALCDYQESVTTGQTHRGTDRQMDRQRLDQGIPMCRLPQINSNFTMPWRTTSAEKQQ